MDTRSWSFIASACIGKEAFSTPQIASKVQRRRAKKRRTYKVKQHVYHCKACGNFHIGTQTKSRHAADRRRNWPEIEDDESME